MEKSYLWPNKREKEIIIYGNNKLFYKFCPEVAFESFGYFASYLGRYSDELDHDLAHENLGKINASSEDYRCSWSSVIATHFSECPLYSVLIYRQGNKKNEGSKGKHEEWYKRPFGMVIIGVAVTVISGLILAFLL